MTRSPSKMNETAHTPGPWAWRYETDPPIARGWYLGPGVLIAAERDGTPGGDEIDRANARLIAAAPDMLAALKAIDKSWTETFPEGPDGNRAWGSFGELSEESVELWRTFRAAISKATAPTA